MTPVRMHADEVHTDVSLVGRLVAAQLPRWAHLAVEPVASSGTDNAMYRLGDELVVRLPRIPSAVDAIARELRWAPRLAPHLPVAVPVPVASGRPAAGYPFPWSVLPWLPGRNPLAGRVTRADRLAVDLAGFVRELRRVDPTDGPPAGRGVPLAARDDDTRAAIAALDGVVDTDAVTAVWADALRPAAGSTSVAWCHGDLSPGNVLVHEDGTLAAVIDLAGVGVGDPTVDLSVAWNLLPADARPVFRDALGVDEATWLRGRAWALSIALIQLPYYRETNPVLAANSRHVIAEVLADAG
ncbi:aminoglycoside phosphotransferase family protein [Micromonospora sp. NPDC000207]|uniref:aminoglycoside phosphotransferase family protein n=1 Tax=Micromonospora sp. NPDC000207 TaxID=3154246 RepID=UPI0033231108